MEEKIFLVWNTLALKLLKEPKEPLGGGQSGIPSGDSRRYRMGVKALGLASYRYPDWMRYAVHAMQYMPQGRRPVGMPSCMV